MSLFSLGDVAFTATPSKLDKGLQDDKERYKTLLSCLNATAMSPNSSYAESKDMKRKHLKIILISFFIVPYNASADQTGLSLEPLAMANINCAAFYAAAQVLIKPEAKKEYESKFSMHYALSHQLSSSYETLAKNLNKEIQRQATEALSLKEHTQAVNFLTKNSIKCSTIEIHSTAIIKNNTTSQ
ncbi:hypothetical protein [Pseudomonas sp. GM48]|uniref:hypothetical protein n=1 Tax=Pseudomonas sp. GM48 TaxID=1144330 RepID=UPI00026FFF4C|nr:hypothetical protein [Pseudomonas sp. GM48]EJM58448.1 hypothetical protein PMI28_02162 [Pseudomonas sp. GM48]